MVETPAKLIAKMRNAAYASLDEAATLTGVLIDERARAACVEWLLRRMTLMLASLSADDDLAQFPAGKDLVERAFIAWRGRVSDLLAHLARDRAELGESTTIAAWHSHGEGLHARATTVGIELLGGERWFHRTRDRRLAAWFQDVCGALVAAGLSLHVRRILVRNGYSWDEGVAASLVSEPSAIRRYFVRAGMLVRLLERFAGVDFHTRNIVAAGEFPVIVDIETLFVPYPPSISPATSALMRSPLRSGLIHLPIAYPSKLPIDGSGLHPGGTLRAPFDECGQPVIEEVAPTIPAPLADHVADLLEGWDAMEDGLARVDLGAWLTRVPELWRRGSLGNGRRNREILENSLAPSLLRSHANRDRWLASHGLLVEELEAIRAVELPRPMVEIGAHEMCSAQAPFSPTERSRRHDLISSVIALRDDRPPVPASRALPPSRLAIAVELGDRLLALRFAGSEWHGVRWFPELGLRTIAVLGGDLYGGTAGIALVFAMIARASGLSRFYEAAHAAFATLPDERASVGAMGLGGAIYALAYGGELIAAPSLIERARVLVAAAPHPAPPLDIVDGLAGFVLGARAAGHVPPAALGQLASAYDASVTIPSPLAEGIPPCVPHPRDGIAHVLARCGHPTIAAEWRPARPSVFDAVDDALLAAHAGDALAIRALHDLVTARVELRRSTGHWFSTSIAERHQTSIVDGIPGVIHALLSAEDPSLRAIRRME